MASSLENALNRAVKGGSAVVQVGFFEGPVYPDGTPVPLVAFWNEFGTRRAPPRPFFRNMIAAKSPSWGPELGRVLKATGGDVPRALALMGERINDQLKQSIVDFDNPGNAPATIRAKGFDKPLIDTGTMQRSTGYEVKE